MYAYLKKFFFGFLMSENDFYEKNQEEYEEHIVNAINAEDSVKEHFSEQSRVVKLLGQSKPEQYNVEVFKCVNKTGKVTFLCPEYGIIDDFLYFEPSQVDTVLSLKQNDEVFYTSYKSKENEAQKIFKIYAIKNDLWDCEVQPNSGIFNTDEKVEDIAALTRIINGRVIRKKDREIFIEPSNIWCNLDKIKASYVPVQGDWVSLEATVTVNEENIDLIGDVLEVISLKPLLAKTGLGRITLWSNITEEGAIENLIYFTKLFCDDGYYPNLGDEVIYDAIESDQERYKWRALKVIPNKIVHALKSHNNLGIFCDKNDISIKPSLCTVEIELHKTKEVVFEVINNGNIEQILRKTKFNSRKEKSQTILKLPNLNDSFTIKPKDIVKYTFEISGKFLGLSKEIFIFYFENFIIGRTFEINVVGTKEMNKLLSCKVDTVFKLVQDKKFVKNNINAETVFYGPKLWKAPRFIAGEKRGVYKVPDKLWTAVVGGTEFTKKGKEKIKALEEYAPYLKEDLNINHYVDRFHILLYLEEIEIKNNCRKHDMFGVFLFRKGEFLVLEVPGLVERRPSLIAGDKLILTQPWSKTNDVQQIGYIHEIRQNEVYVKFHGSFHDSYDESECNIIFEPNLNALGKSHDAINRSLKKLGAKWLFPSSVEEKPPQISFYIPEESINESKSVANFFSEVSKNEKSELNMKKKKLTWFNKNLNDRQKLAVINALKGQGRPLPYIIFGPPGTGKTVTVVEIILQIYHLMPESRLLITTPSNSSADLICERLIEIGGFKPGQLVRLLAFCRASEGNISEKLIPFSTMVDIRDDSGKNLNPLNNKNNIQSSTLSQLTGRHRITVGTCVCIGSLHYLGFSPNHFTHILIDEAGQATEPEILISATFQNVQNGQIILAGDPQQLGPVCISKLADQFGLGVSLLQRLVSTFPYIRDFDAFPKTSGFDPRFITKLNVNYRSVPEILSLPSQLFYNSELIPTVSQKEGIEADIIQKFNFEVADRKKPPAIIFHGIIGVNYQESDSPSWYNPHEIWQCVSYLKKLYTIGLTSADVGIVTPYSKQVQKLRRLLSALELSEPKIGTVEEFQGQERFVIIISTVRSSFSYLNSDIFHSLGFLASPRRLNVALTRARALVIILGNPILLSHDPYWKSVVKYCVKNCSYIGCNLNQNYENIAE